jgi:hypothetical protein
VRGEISDKITCYNKCRGGHRKTLLKTSHKKIKLKA